MRKLVAADMNDYDMYWVGEGSGLVEGNETKTGEIYISKTETGYKRVLRHQELNEDFEIISNRLIECTFHTSIKKASVA